MSASTRFQTYDPDQLRLLPEDMRQWLPEDHLVYFVMDLVDTLDLKEIYTTYDDGSAGGRPPYHPKMLVSLLLYAYCTGMPSSRRIQRATYEMVPFRILAGDQHPDHATISGFRQTHLPALARLFIQILALCRKAGLVKLGHVALDGTKVKANASKHKAMSYGHMQSKARELQAEVDRLLAEAEKVDAIEDTKHGPGRRGDELPDELRFKQSRLKKIQEAQKALEEEARERARAEQPVYEEKVRKRKKRGGAGRAPKPPSDQPESKAQRNFTDPDSRIMPTTGNSFEQAYNAQAAVDECSQVIVACGVAQTSADSTQLQAMVQAIETNTGSKPAKLTADSNYFSEDNVTLLQGAAIDPFIATDKGKHGLDAEPCAKGRIPDSATIKDRMRRKLRTVKGRAIYALRKQIVEPVFGQIKTVRGFDRFSVRGIERTTNEWAFVCTSHNLLKLFRSGWRTALA